MQIMLRTFHNYFPLGLVTTLAGLLVKCMAYIINHISTQMYALDESICYIIHWLACLASLWSSLYVQVADLSKKEAEWLKLEGELQQKIQQRIEVCLIATF